jgi:hypothetical protein
MLAPLTTAPAGVAPGTGMAALTPTATAAPATTPPAGMGLQDYLRLAQYGNQGGQTLMEFAGQPPSSQPRPVPPPGQPLAPTAAQFQPQRGQVSLQDLLRRYGRR